MTYITLKLLAHEHIVKLTICTSGPEQKGVIEM